jgi:putative nucleotidyltransferase with HDIG domain
MSRPAHTVAARQVEQIIRRFGSLSTLPAVVARFLAQGSSPTSVDAVAELIESDAALSAMVYSLAHQHGIAVDGTAVSIAHLVRQLSPGVVRDAVLSTKVFQALGDEQPRSEAAILSRKNLARHSLAVACCARALARLCLPESDAAMAFSAGLLHDIGKLAIEEALPKSFEKIVATARRQSASSCDIEQLHLGLDHATIGKRLAQKLHVPDEIATAIWLHHSSTDLVEENIPAARIAPVVRLADAVVRAAGIGESGSYDPPAETITECAAYLKLSEEQLASVQSTLVSDVARRAQLLGLEDTSGEAAYCGAVQSTAVQLSSDVARLTVENKRLATGATIFDFTDAFFEALNATSTPIDIAGDFARRWQRSFQTGPVCVCLPDPLQPAMNTAVTLSADAKVDSLLVTCPGDKPLIPPQMQKSFAVAPADEVSWLLPQLPIEMDAGRTRIAPLMAGNKAAALLVFEQRYVPSSNDYLKTFAEISSIAGGVIALALAQQKHQEMAERFVLLSGRLRQAQKYLADASALVGLAEMAAGAAHELNTPLAVISGRAQLLLDTEDDPQKKNVLGQMIERCTEVSQIIHDLLAFAEPSRPRPAASDVHQLIEDAIDQAAIRLGSRSIEVELGDVSSLPQVLIDPSQVVPAITNILVNAQEAYPGGAGPVTIIASADDQAGFVNIDIADQAAGMTAEVLAKATQPFFSSKPAGRQRGMGLAHAKRFVQLNGGSLAIASQPGAGTTVSLSLPIAKVS